MSSEKTPNNVALSLHGIGKAYRLGSAEKAHRGAAATTTAWLARAVRNWKQLQSLGSASHAPDEEDVIWALKDISFTIERGEIVGLIGRNGAGKSTLLKVLARITTPSAGHAVVYGRMGSLLEVGTGFHPELTGRENVFLNGAILGMRRREIAAAFDSIVDFSGVERFLDTPVKRYSSGMRVRLAFAVAAHLQPDVLLIDEVLAVGDAAFQKKCLQQMENVGDNGRTIIFVSHNMSSVARLCNRTIALNRGQVVADGPSAQVIEQYATSLIDVNAERRWDTDAPGNDWAHLLAVRVLDAHERITTTVEITEATHLEMEYEVFNGGRVLAPSIQVRDAQDVLVFISIDVEPAWSGRPKPPGKYRSRVTIPGNLMAEGGFFVSAVLSTIEPVHLCFFERDAVMFHVIDSGLEGSARGGFAETIHGVVRPKLPWQTARL